jgi:hypothetical protein
MLGVLEHVGEVGRRRRLGFDVVLLGNLARSRVGLPTILR